MITTAHIWLKHCCLLASKIPQKWTAKLTGKMGFRIRHKMGRHHQYVPIRHLVEVLGKTRQIRRLVLVLLLHPEEYLRDFNPLKQLGVQQRHLLCQLFALEVGQGILPALGETSTDVVAQVPRKSHTFKNAKNWSHSCSRLIHHCES